MIVALIIRPRGIIQMWGGQSEACPPFSTAMASIALTRLCPSLALQPLFCPARQCYISIMMTAEDIEKAIEQLDPRELARFRAWFETFDAQQFDAAIERDARAGKLDAHADEALAAHRAGRSREL
jgi:hypothetical protein